MNDMSKNNLNDNLRELEEREKNLKMAQEVAHIGSWEWDMLSNKITWSDELYRIYGLELQSFEASYEAFLKYIHPDDKEMVNKIVQDAAENKKPFDFYHRVVRPDGEERILHGIGNVYVDEDGNAIRMNGTAQDVTDLKKVEDALVKQRDMLEKMNKFMVDRELKMTELKKEIAELKKNIQNGDDK